MARPCTNADPCLGWTPGKGGHSSVCARLVAQGAKPRVARPALRPARLNLPKLDVAKGDGAIGCACGAQVVPDRKTSLRVNGIEHRYGKPCRPTRGGTT